MAKRVSQAILLCEDAMHFSLMRAFLKCAGIHNVDRIFRDHVASRETEGGNVGWVLKNFPTQLSALRARRSRAESMLIVMVDADETSCEERLRELSARVKADGLEPLEPDEIKLLVPKRNVETWIMSLRGIDVNEHDDYKKRQAPSRDELKQAASSLYDWSRANAQLKNSCVPSLHQSLPVWRSIEECLK